MAVVAIPVFHILVVRAAGVVVVVLIAVEFLHIGVLCSQSWNGDLVEKQLSLVWTDGRVELIDGLSPVILLTQLLQNLTGGRTDAVTLEQHLTSSS